MKKSYVILTETNKWVATGKSETKKEFDETIKEIVTNHENHGIEKDTKLFVVFGDVQEIPVLWN